MEAPHFKVDLPTLIGEEEVLVSLRAVNTRLQKQKL